MKKLTQLLTLSIVLTFWGCGDDSDPKLGDGNNGTTTNNGTNNGTTPANNGMNNNGATNNGTTPTNNGTSPTNNGATNNGFVECGEVTLAGTCEGDSVRFCHPDDGLVVADCPATFGAGATCEVFPDWGADCSVPEGSACEVYDGNNFSFYQAHCQGTDAACIWNDANSGICETNFSEPNCTAETFEESCVGDVFLYMCYIDHPVGIDCVESGGSCTDSGCMIPAGGACDGLVLLCEGNLNCAFSDTEYLGTCE